LQAEIARTITHTASIATKNFGGRKQLAISPQANAKAQNPLL